MRSKTLMSVEEYLHTTFEGADREYVDGEIIERNMGRAFHGDLQFLLATMIAALAQALRLRVIPETRIQISPTVFRIPDISVWRVGSMGGDPPTKPPLLAIEILSPDDRLIRVEEKVREYLAFGVEWVWVIDAEERLALVYSQGNRAGEITDVLRTENPEIRFTLSEILEKMPGDYS